MNALNKLQALSLCVKANTKTWQLNLDHLDIIIAMFALRLAITLKTASLETTGPFIRAVFEVSASVEFRMMLECDRLH